MTSPPDPFTKVAAAAVQMHELKTAFVEAGFTDAEAMQLVIALLVKSQQEGRS